MQLGSTAAEAHLVTRTATQSAAHYQRGRAETAVWRKIPAHEQWRQRACVPNLNTVYLIQVAFHSESVKYEQCSFSPSLLKCISQTLGQDIYNLNYPLRTGARLVKNQVIGYSKCVLIHTFSCFDLILAVSLSCSYSTLSPPCLYSQGAAAKTSSITDIFVFIAVPMDHFSTFRNQVFK